MDQLGEKFTGCLLGLACGDALGAPLEFMSPEAIAIKHGRVTEMIGGGWQNTFPGQYTDDTQMMMCLARSLIEKKTFDPADVAQRYVEWWKTNPRDIGQVTKVSLELIAGGTSIEEAALIAHQRCEEKSAGNGTIMRTAPLALVYHRRWEELIECSIKEARITHYDKLAGLGSACLNILISHALDCYPESPAPNRKGRLSKEQKRKNRQMRLAVLEQCWNLMRSRSTEYYGLLRGVADKGESDLDTLGYVTGRVNLPTSGFVMHTMETALWCFLNSNGFEQAVVTAVNLGGDADTIGAVTGTLAGAFYGLPALPERWLATLQDRYVIEDMATELYNIYLEQR
jgi:ADP-ribosyl-[dinitrogen reductase] hydrolase